jgi:hypothetical protein
MHSAYLKFTHKNSERTPFPHSRVPRPQNRGLTSPSQQQHQVKIFTPRYVTNNYILLSNISKPKLYPSLKNEITIVKIVQNRRNCFLLFSMTWKTHATISFQELRSTTSGTRTMRCESRTCDRRTTAISHYLQFCNIITAALCKCVNYITTCL